jgi:hypothetical protein
VLTSTHEHDPSDGQTYDQSGYKTLSRPEREELLRDAVLGCPISPDEGHVLTLLSHFDEDTLVPLIGLFDRVRAIGLEPRRQHTAGSVAGSTLVVGVDGVGGVDAPGVGAGWTEEQRRHTRTGVGILTAWLAEPDGSGQMASGYIEALMTESAGAQIGAIVWGLVNVGGHLLTRTAQAEGTTSDQVLQGLAIACAG